MEIKVKTLTPLWTGGVEAGKCDRIHETGILGSLRWWMEVLVRGLGGNVCDPTEQKCSAKNRLCEVCKIFGAEGQKRRFRLEVIQDITQPDNIVTSTIQAARSNAKKGKPPTWYFPQDLEDKPRSGKFTLQIQSLHPGFKPEVLSGLIQFVADWSALGARPQMGFGVIQIEESRINTQSLYEWLKEIEGTAKEQNRDSELPSLQNIFLAKIQPKDPNSSFNEKDTFNLKYDLRQLFRTEESKTAEKKIQNQGELKGLILKKDRQDNNVTKSDDSKDLRHFIMGAVEDDRMAAKIKISRPYNGKDGKPTMRVWGWIPAQAEVYEDDWNREKIVNAIYKHLSVNYTLHEWREMDSARDETTPDETDAKAFLHSLLGL
jgi:CRISPR-associated protein Cmr1